MADGGAICPAGALMVCSAAKVGRYSEKTGGKRENGIVSIITIYLL